MLSAVCRASESLVTPIMASGISEEAPEVTSVVVSSGKLVSARETACSTLAVARAVSVPYSNSTVIIAYDDEDDVVVDLTSGMVATCCSIGTAMRSFICSEVAPGEIAITETAGSSTGGISSLRIDCNDSMPSTDATTQTKATKGRFLNDARASLSTGKRLFPLGGSPPFHT